MQQGTRRCPSPRGAQGQRRAQTSKWAVATQAGEFHTRVIKRGAGVSVGWTSELGIPAAPLGVTKALGTGDRPPHPDARGVDGTCV